MTLDPGPALASVAQTLRHNPLCLAIAVLVIVLQVIAYYRETHAQEDRAQVVQSLIERCMEPAKR